jgi:hypothetical protein
MIPGDDRHGKNSPIDWLGAALLRRALAARLAAKMMLTTALWDGYPSRVA